MRRALPALLLAACSFNFNRPSDVKDLRVLAMQADPPELTVQTRTPQVTVSALIAGDDGGAPLSYVWTTCLSAPMLGGGGAGFGAGLGSGASRCADDDGGTTVVQSSGMATPDQLSTAIDIPREVVGLVLSGTKGLTLQWQVQLQVDDLYALKQIVVTPTLPDGQNQNQNPTVDSLSIDGEDWPLGATKSVVFDSCPSDKRVMMMGARGMTTSGPCRHEILPFVDAGQNQIYFAQGTSGDVQQQAERMRFSWFADDGYVENETTQQPNPDLPIGRTTASTFWREPTEKPDGGPINFWIVVRDGRGGESWTQRQLVFP